MARVCVNTAPVECPVCNPYACRLHHTSPLFPSSAARSDTTPVGHPLIGYPMSG